MSKWNKMRYDGKNTKYALVFALLLGIFGAEYFYLRRTKLGWIKLGISFLGATITTVVWIIYGSISLPDNFDYDLAIVLPSVLGGLFVIATFLWSLYNAALIFTGKFRDEHNQQVGSWNSNHNDLVDYLINL